MSEIIGFDALDMYRDLFDKTEHELMRETMLAAEMRSTCSHCGETRLGPASEVRDWFKDHALSEHGIVVKGGSRKKLARVNLALTLDQKAQAAAARANLVNPEFPSYHDKLAEGRAKALVNVHTKWSRESLIEWRDRYVAEHGRKPACDMRGGPSWTPVKRVFGSWTKYMEAT